MAVTNLPKIISGGFYYANKNIKKETKTSSVLRGVD